MFDKFGRVEGFGQIAPERDLPHVRQPGQPGRPRTQPAPNIATAIGAPPIPTPMAGASVINTPAPLGFDPNKWSNPNKQSPKYIVGRSLQSVRDQFAGLDEVGQKKFVENHLKSLVPEIQKQGWKVHDVRNEKMLISGGPNNEPPHWADAVGDIGGASTVQWYVNQPGGGGGGIAALSRAIGGFAPATTQPTVQSGDYATRVREQIMRALQGNPVLAMLGKSFF